MQATQLTFFFNAISTLIRPGPKSHALIINPRDPKAVWIDLVNKYFQGRSELMDYKVFWSKRPQKRVLASCNIEKKVVRIAPAMKLPESQPFLEALIYHELCHAVCGIGFKNGRRDIHSKRFKELEMQHPQILSLDLWIKQGGWIKAVRKSTRMINREKLGL